MDTLNKFIAACNGTPAPVFIWKKAKDDARRLLKLLTDQEILDFIGNGGLECVQALHKPPFKDKQGNNTGITINAYKFSSNLVQMYLAFFYSPGASKWNLKSFHEPNDPEPTLGGQLHKAILQKQLEENS